MERYDALNAPAPGAPYVNADLVGGTQGSYPPAEVFDAVQTEIIAAITALGGAPSNVSWTQLGSRIIAYVAAQITAGVASKVSKVGDAMTGLLSILNSVNTNGTGSNLLRLLRGTGAGRTGNVGVIADGANGISAMYLMIAEANGTAVATGILQVDGRMTIGADGTGPTDVVTVQQLAAATTVPDASTAVKGKVRLSTDAVAIAKASTTDVLVASNLAALGATPSFAGLIAKAIASEVDTGTDAAKAMTAAAYAGSKRSIRAWAEFGSITTPVITESFGISGITKVGSKAAVVFSTARPSAGYVVTPNGTVAAGNNVSYDTRTTSGFNIFVINTAGGLTDGTGLNFTVYGNA